MATSLPGPATAEETPERAGDAAPRGPVAAAVSGVRPSSEAQPRPWCRWTVLVGLLALAVRVLVVLSEPIRLANDSADYQRLAVSIATGHGFGTSHFAPGGGPTALRPPLFPLVVGAVYKVVGTHLVAARLVEAVLGAIGVVLLVVLTWLLWGRAVGLTTGVLAAVFPPQVMATTSLMSEAVALPLEAAALLAAVYYRRTGRMRWAVGSGAALGLLVLDRTSLAVLVVPVGLLLFRHRPSWRRLAPLGALLLAATAVVTPWLVRDRVVLHHWVPVTTQSGYVLSGTYNATSAADPRHPAAWRPANLDPATSAVIRHHPHADEVQLDGLLQSAATRYLTSHPGYFGTVVVQNSLRLFDLQSPAQVRTETTSEYGYSGTWGDLEFLGGIAVLALALAGAVTRQGRRVPVAYLVAPLLLWVSTVVLQAVPRFRAVIDPFLLQLAALALLALVPELRRRLDAAPSLPAGDASPAGSDS